MRPALRHGMFSALFAAAKLRADLHVSTFDVGKASGHPIIRPADFITALIKHNRLDLLLPAADAPSSKPILREFWGRFRRQYGSNLAIFEACSEADLSLVVPCKIHGDEGRSAWSPLTASFFTFC